MSNTFHKFDFFSIDLEESYLPTRFFNPSETLLRILSLIFQISISNRGDTLLYLHFCPIYPMCFHQKKKHCHLSTEL